MPRGDQTGPEGLGSMTGRRMGYCAGSESPGFTKCRPGKGRPGRGAGPVQGGSGAGLGRRHRHSREEEISFLENSMKKFEKKLETVQKRIKDLKNNSQENTNN
jgi:hypothetical protein